jgi:hypothetical protein
MKKVISPSLLQLSPNEIKVFQSIRNGFCTPLRISRDIAIPRPTVYITLEVLEARMLIGSKKEKGKKVYVITDRDTLEDSLYKAKQYIFQLHEGTDEVKSRGDSMVRIHRGKDAIQKVITSMVNAKGEILSAIQGHVQATGWETVFGKEIVTTLNKHIKQNNVVTQAIIPHTWMTLWGKDWAEHFSGRATAQYEVPDKYLKSGAELFIFQNTAYLLALHEETIIEIHNSAIVDMCALFIQYFKDTGKHIRVNEQLTQYISKK